MNEGIVSSGIRKEVCLQRTDRALARDRQPLNLASVVAVDWNGNETGSSGTMRFSLSLAWLALVFLVAAIAGGVLISRSAGLVVALPGLACLLAVRSRAQ
jgi:hypothetical protein